MASRSKEHMARWERGQGLNDRMLDELSQDFSDLLDAELKEIEAQASSGQGDEALGRLSKLSAFASTAAVHRPSLFGTLGQKVEAFRAALEAVAHVSGAVEFSLTFGVPTGISLTLTFRVAGTEGKPAEPG